MSCCSQKIQETGPLLCAAMELCSLRGLGDLFPVESLRKTKMKLHNESKWCREWKEIWEEEGRVIFCVRSRWRKRRLLGWEGESKLISKSLRWFSQRLYDHFPLVAVCSPSRISTLIEGLGFLVVQKRFHQTRQGPSLCYALTCRRSCQGPSLCYWTARGRERLHNRYEIGLRIKEIDNI